MNQSPNRRTFGSSGKSKKSDLNLDLKTVRQMLPLVRSIVQDIQNSSGQLERLQPVQENLDRHRIDLVWQEREHRYLITAEIEKAQKDLTAAVTELKQLGVSLADEAIGRVEFPTRINGRPAAFSWQTGEEDVGYWYYAEEDTRRTIPEDWLEGSANPATRNS